MSKSLEAIQAVENDVNAIVAKGKYKEADSPVVASRIFIDVAREIDALILQFNPIKKVLDDAYKAGDVDAFAEAHEELNKLLYRVDFSNLTAKVNRRKRWLKAVTPLRFELLKKFAFIKSARDDGAGWIKRQRMTPAQRSAAHKASVRMKLAWF